MSFLGTEVVINRFPLLPELVPFSVNGELRLGTMVNTSRLRWLGLEQKRCCGDKTQQVAFLDYPGKVVLPGSAQGRSLVEGGYYVFLPEMYKTLILLMKCRFMRTCKRRHMRAGIRVLKVNDGRS